MRQVTEFGKDEKSAKGLQKGLHKKLATAEKIGVEFILTNHTFYPYYPIHD